MVCSNLHPYQVNTKHFEFISAHTLNQGHVGDVLEAASTLENKRKWFGSVSMLAKESIHQLANMLIWFNQALMLSCVWFGKRSSVLDAWSDSRHFKYL